MREKMNTRSTQKSFFKACKEGDVKIAKTLIEKGANVNMKNKDGLTPFMIASFCRNVEICNFLLEEGVNMEEVVNMEGDTLLIFASRCVNIEVIKFLIEKGADIEVSDNQGRYYYHFLHKEYREEIDLFLEDIEKRKRMIKPCKFLATCS